jgi:hypothetical protein
MVRAFGINVDFARIVMARIIRRLIMPFTFAAMILPLGVFAQSVFPAPLPGQHGAPTSGPLSFIAPEAEAPSDACVRGFVSLRANAEERNKMIKAASGRHAPPLEACKLIRNLAQSEITMIKYLEATSVTCGISPQVSDQIKVGHHNTEALLARVCALARQARSVFEPAPLSGDFPQLDWR